MASTELTTPYYFSEEVLSKAKTTAEAIARSETGLPDPNLLTGIHELVDLLEVMTDGQRVTLIPVQSELDPEHAAEVLGCSVSYFVKLLDAGDIPFRSLDGIRLARLEDILQYKQEKKRLRQQVLADLVQEAQDLNMGY